MEKQSMEAIYNENASAVYKYLFCLTRDTYLAEELTQETFYQATKGIHHFRGDCKITVWLCEIAKRLWYKELGKDKLILLDEMEEIQADVNLEKQHILNMDKMELFKLLHSLDAASREVVYLRLTGELSFSEIGNIMGKTENWARVTFYRGKQKIVKGRKIDE